MEHPPSTDADPAAWRMVRLYDDGVESHWGEAEFALKAGGAIGKLSEKIPCDGAYLRYTKGSYDFPWHNAPRRQIVVCLNSRTEVTTRRGVTKTFGAGDLVLALGDDAQRDRLHAPCRSAARQLAPQHR